jgi:UDP-glucose 4-epimerase
METVEGLKAFVAGGAGFIGSHLVDRLIAEGAEVTVYDNLASGKKEFFQLHNGNPRFKFIKGDLLEPAFLKESMFGHDLVCHLAANPQASEGIRQTRLDLEQNTIATYNVLESMRINKVGRILFTSSGTVYGETSGGPVNEEYGPLMPISLYGASKLACEGLISAFASLFGIRAWIFRIGNVVGPRATHGVIHDLLQKIRKDPTTLEVLGDGYQTKPYIHINDCVDGLLLCLRRAQDTINLFNLAPSTTTSVKAIAEMVLDFTSNKQAVIRYSGGVKGGGGWPGDVTRVQLDAKKARDLGWTPKFTSDEAVAATIRSILEQGN